VDHGDGRAEQLLDVLEERDDLFGFFGGEFDVSQHDFHDGIQPRHQHRAFTLTGSVQVKHIAAFERHGLLDASGALMVRQGQRRDKLSAQDIDFALAYAHVVCGQFRNDFLAVAVS